jgi:predicted secreted hydrolase
MTRLSLKIALILVIFGLMNAPTLREIHVSAQDGPKGNAQAVYTFPQDHWPHVSQLPTDKHYLEWFYYTGLLYDSDGRLWGFQVTLFYGKPAAALGSRAFLYDIALSDVTSQRYLHYRGFWFEGNQLAMYEDEWFFDNRTLILKYSAETERWSIGFSGEMTDKSTGQPVFVAFDFLLSPDAGAYYAHAEDGIHPIGICGRDLENMIGYTGYYTHPNLSTSGTLSIGDTAVLDITGSTWFDHQWGNFVHCELAWDWFSLRFDDGSFMMISWGLTTNTHDTSANLLATYIDSSGDAHYWTQEAVQLTPLREWTHPLTGVVFPVDWVIDTPLGRFAITPVFDYQAGDHFAGIPDYWEGVVTIHQEELTGEQIGWGYLEVAR